MAFEKSNLYLEGNSEEYFFKRTNPLANATNAEFLKIKECGQCDVELVVSIATAGDTTFTFASPTNGYQTNFVKATITDKKGNFATDFAEGVVAELVVDTTTLDASGSWEVTIEVELEAEKAIECACSKMFTFEYDSIVGKDIDTTIFAVLQTKPTVNLGTFPIGISEEFSVQLKNVGVGVMKIESVTANPNVLTATLPAFGDVVYPSNSVTITGTVDTSLGAGAQSGTIDIVSTGGNATITINYTLV